MAYQPFKTVEDSVLNNSVTPLGAGQTYTGEWEKIRQPDVKVSCETSAEGKLFFDFSIDGVNATTFPVNGFDLVANIHEYHKACKAYRFFRVRVVNGTTPQTFLRLATYYGIFSENNAPLNQTISDDSDATTVKAVLAGKKVDGNLEETTVYDNVNITQHKEITASLSPRVIFEAKTPEESIIPSGGLPPVIDPVKNTEANLIDSSWISVKQFGGGQFLHVLSNAGFTIYLLNASDELGNNLQGSGVPALISGNSLPATIGAPFFDNFFRIIAINASGIPATQYTIRSSGAQVQPASIYSNLDTRLFDFFPAPLNRSVITGKTPSEEYVNTPVSGLDKQSHTQTPLVNSLIGVYTANPTLDTITAVGSGLTNDTPVVITTTVLTPLGLAVDTVYFVVNVVGDTFQLSETIGGLPVDIEDVGTGVQSLYAPGIYESPYQDARGHASAVAFVISDKPISSVKLRWSNDGENGRGGLLEETTLTGVEVQGFWVYIDTLTTLIDNYCRLEIINGSTDQGLLETDIWFYSSPYTGSFNGLDSALSTLSTALLTRSVIAGIDTNGDFNNVRINSGNALLTANFGKEVALGNIPNYKIKTVNGRNSGLSSGQSGDMTGSGGIYSGHPIGFTPETVRVTSSSANDTIGGTGARTVRIYGLKTPTSSEVEMEDINMGGIVGTLSTNTWWRIYKTEILTAGSLGTNSGTISVFSSVTVGNIFSTIGNTRNFNNSTDCVYTVPFNKKVIVDRVRLGAIRTNGGTTVATFSLRYRPQGGVYKSIPIDTQSGASINFQFSGGLILEAGTDIKMRIDFVSDTTTVGEGAIEFYEITL